LENLKKDGDAFGGGVLTAFNPFGLVGAAMLPVANSS
jgi:hypothetical protein